MDLFGIDTFKKLIADLRSGAVTVVVKIVNGAVEVSLKDNAQSRV